MTPFEIPTIEEVMAYAQRLDRGRFLEKYRDGEPCINFVGRFYWSTDDRHWEDAYGESIENWQAYFRGWLRGQLSNPRFKQYNAEYLVATGQPPTLTVDTAGPWLEALRTREAELAMLTDEQLRERRAYVQGLVEKAHAEIDRNTPPPPRAAHDTPEQRTERLSRRVGFDLTRYRAFKQALFETNENREQHPSPKPTPSPDHHDP